MFTKQIFTSLFCLILYTLISHILHSYTISLWKQMVMSLHNFLPFLALSKIRILLFSFHSVPSSICTNGSAASSSPLFPSILIVGVKFSKSYFLIMYPRILSCCFLILSMSQFFFVFFIFFQIYALLTCSQYPSEDQFSCLQ